MVWTHCSTERLRDTGSSECLEKLRVLCLARVELQDVLFLYLDAILWTFIHQGNLEMLSLYHWILAISQDSLRDHILIHFLSSDHLFVSLKMVFTKGHLSPFDKRVVQVLGRRFARTELIRRKFTSLRELLDPHLLRICSPNIRMTIRNNSPK